MIDFLTFFSQMAETARLTHRRQNPISRPEAAASPGRRFVIDA
jgi:hypothetical protein